MEIKLASSGRFAGKMKKWKEESAEAFAAMPQKFVGVLLVHTEVSRQGRSAWNLHCTGVQVLKRGGDWESLGEGPRKRGPDLRLLRALSSLQAHRDPRTGRKVYKVADFLKSLGKSVHNVGGMCKQWNSHLRVDGLRARCSKVNIRTSPGDQPWCASRLCLKMVYRRCT